MPVKRPKLIVTPTSNAPKYQENLTSSLLRNAKTENRQQFLNSSHRRDHRGLRPLLATRLGEAHEQTDEDILECAVVYAGFVEIHLASVHGLDESVALIGIDAGDLAERRLFVGLHLAALLAHMALELAPRRVEGVAYRHIKVFVRFALDHQLGARNRQIDADIVEHAVLLTAMRGLHQHPATHDAIVKGIELRGLFTYGRLCRL